MTTHDRPAGPARRIALVTSRYWPSFGGIQSHVQALAEHLVGAGHDVTVLTHDLDGDDPEHDVLNGVRVQRFLPLVPSEHLLLAPALGAHLASSRSSYDVVHVHGYHDTPAALVMRSWEGPYVFTPHFHGSSASRIRTALHVPYRRVGRRIVHHARRVVCVTPSEREAFLRWFPTATDKTEVISNGVDVDRLRTASARTAEPDGRRLLVTAGRLEAYKRVDRTVDAMAHLGDRFVLEVCGDGPERAALEQRASRAGLDHAVRFRGRVSDAELASTIASAAVLVSMSEHEAQGIVLLEAAAAGTASVASAIPAHADVADTTGATHLVEADAASHRLADAIAEVAARPRPTAAVASWPEVAARTALLYDDVLRARPAGSATRVGGGVRPPA